MVTSSHSRRRLGIGLAGALVVLAGVAAWNYIPSLRLTAALLGIRAAFRNVKHISTAELSDWRADPGRAPPLLLDVREPAEFAVSHLAGARNVPWGSDWQRAFKDMDIPKTQAIVVYCSIGYRSSVLARKLEQAGFAQVVNLEGSIFKWASEGRPLIRPGGQAAAVVHPYDAKWGRLLAPDLRAPLP